MQLSAGHKKQPLVIPVLFYTGVRHFNDALRLNGTMPERSRVSLPTSIEYQ
ncbi:Rpn family recombination-promoting nuclease/putative transposase [Salmonella enterica]|nr:Rpn family recombination-promoting nuclease/putative transposase [Salmonella enterica]